MSELLLNNSILRATPAVGLTTVYSDVSDRRIKTVDETGIVSILTNNGWLDQNLLINGGFDFAQRQVPGTPTAYSNIGGRIYCADRWFISNAAASINYSRGDSTSTIESNLDAAYYGVFTPITNPGKFFVGQVIEGANMMALRGKKVRFQCKMRQTVAVAANDVRLGIIELQNAGTIDTILRTAGNFISAFNGAGVDPTLTVGQNLAYIAPTAGYTPENGTIDGNAIDCAVNANWVRYGGIFTIPTTAKNIIVGIWTDQSYPVADTLRISEAGLYLGQEIKEWINYPQDYILKQCQRYYCKTYSTLVAPGTITVVGALRWQLPIAGAVAQFSHWRFPNTMRITPTVLTSYNPAVVNALVRNITAGTDATVTTLPTASTDAVDINFTGPAPWAAGQELKLHISADADI